MGAEVAPVGNDDVPSPELRGQSGDVQSDQGGCQNEGRRRREQEGGQPAASEGTATKKQVNRGPENRQTERFAKTRCA
jgi:hypothetical protein